MGGGGSSNILNITVLTDKIESKGLVTGGYLDSGASIGVTVTSTSGGNYDNTAYNNIQFTASGTGTSQKWSGGTVKLSATDGYCYAYYPYTPSATSITAIPVTAGGTDFMYATPVTVNDKDKDATLNMKHALAAIRFALKKGTYAGTGAVTAVSVASTALGSSGTLNAKTGGVTAANLGTAVSQSASFNLATETKNVDVVMVPSGNAGTITLSVTIDGKVYSTEVSSTTIKQGSCYTYTITVDAGSLALSGVKVGDWELGVGDNPTITSEGYKITIIGDYKDIDLWVNASTNTMTIKAINKSGLFVNEVTVSSGAAVTQSLLDDSRIITLSNFFSDVTIDFNGIFYKKDMDSGVYAIDSDGKLIDYDTAYADENGIYQGVSLVMKGKTAFEIAKKEAAPDFTNWSDQSPMSLSQQAIFSPFYLNHAYESYDNGWLLQPDGKYHSAAFQIPEDIAMWTSGVTADVDGKGNTDRIIRANVTIAKVIKDFNNGSNNQGCTDWYLPTGSQLSYIAMNYIKVNNLLRKIGGTSFKIKYDYWSSNVYSEEVAWYVRLSEGGLSHKGVNMGSYARLVRDL